VQGVRGVQGILGIPDPIHEPMFTTAERDRRWARLRELMSADGVELLIVLPAWIDSDAMYIADNAGVTIFPLGGEPILILGGESSSEAIHVPQWIDDRLTVTELGSTAADFGRATADALRRRGLTGRRTAIAGLRGGRYSSVRQPEGYVGYTTVQAIAEAVGPEHIVDGTEIIGRARYVKGAEEIERLRASVRIGEESLTAMAASAAVGERQLEVYGQMLLAQVRAGADKLHVAWCPGDWGQPRHRYVSPPPGILTPGLYVSTELMPEVRGYQAQVAQPLVVGEPSARARDVFDRNDGPLVIPTAVADPNSAIADEVILENTTFIFKPFLAVPEAPAAYARTHDVTWGDTIVVTAEGAQRLGTRPRELTVVEV
jgi:Xaa-Pro dipeptidase